MRKKISIETQFWWFVSLMAVWVLGCTFLLGFHHWVWAIGLFVFPFALEYVLRCIKAKKVIIPHRIKEKPRMQHVKANLITSIGELTMDKFIRCRAHNDLNVLGTGTHGQIKACWDDLMGQYYSALKNENLSQYIKLMRRKIALELRRAIADKYCNMLKTMYSKVIADELRKVFPKFKLTLETLEHDVKMIDTSLIAEKIEYDRIIVQLGKMESLKSLNQTPAEIEEEIIDNLIAIREHTKTNYDEKTMTVLTYCLCMNRLYKHYEMLKQQVNG